MDQNLVAVKIGFRGDLHRLRVDLNTFTLDALTQLFVRTFRLAPGSFIIKYTDAEGDTLNVCSDAEFVEACRVFLSGNHDELKALKFTAVEREGAASAAAGPSGNPADPLIQAVERLVVTLNATVDKVRQEEWKGVDVATEALSQAASEVQATLEATRTAVQEKPFDAVVGETSEGLKSAASGISSFAQRFVKSFIPDKKPEAAVVPPPAPVEPLVPVQPEEKVEEVPAVEEPAPALTPVEPEVVVATPPAAAPAVAFSEDEIKWAEQLSMVRGIFPDVETANAIRLLETHGGDVNIVINVLMEEMME